ncbi:hypothetical protein D8674_028137 [Pyrus ussuriensis x Pyrus communis]|uniref:Uncharacterized protein n=1 Tax=Pyrus ussuriensis x Pyrus communis TaxID=2448454 RepID=A0A5N5IEV6_9ROSA|nr:hypothetical protein D8674_028137 [Pyrus ussuriensis x Pyrus communis]
MFPGTRTRTTNVKDRGNAEHLETGKRLLGAAAQLLWVPTGPCVKMIRCRVALVWFDLTRHGQASIVEVLCLPAQPYLTPTDPFVSFNTPPWK